MTDPKRWLDPEGDASHDERALLGALLEVDPSRERVDTSWDHFARATGGGRPVGSDRGGGRTGGHGGGHAGGGLLTTLKPVLIGAGSALLLVAVRSQLGPSPPLPTPTALVAPAPTSQRLAPEGASSVASVTASTQAAPLENEPTMAVGTGGGVALARHDHGTSPVDAGRIAPRTLTPTGDPSSPATDVVAPASTEGASPAAIAPGPADSVAAARASTLREEAASVELARAQLGAGDAARALNTLGATARAFPSGVLAQEREALSIEALVAEGRLSEARARVGAFVRAYPRSPHAPRLARLVE